MLVLKYILVPKWVHMAVRAFLLICARAKHGLLLVGLTQNSPLLVLV